MLEINQIFDQQKVFDFPMSSCRTLLDLLILSIHTKNELAIVNIEKEEHNGYCPGEAKPWNLKRIVEHMKVKLGWKIYVLK
jgi:hypothetical protein